MRRYTNFVVREPQRTTPHRANPLDSLNVTVVVINVNYHYHAVDNYIHYYHLQQYHNL